MKKGKFLSAIAALAMSVSFAVSPVVTSYAAQAPKTQYYTDTQKPSTRDGKPVDQAKATETYTINIHKIVLSPADYSTFEKEFEKDNTRTNGGKIDNLQTFFGSSAVEADKVEFKVYEVSNTATENAITGKQLKEELKQSSNTIDDSKYYILKETKETTTDGTGKITLPKGTYLIVESASRYVTKDGKTLSNKGIAIPILLELPATIYGGDVLHLYPKNTDVDTPDVEKDFSEKLNKRAEGENKEDKANYRVEGVDQKVPYSVETVFKPNTTYKYAYWDDRMTEGLDYDTDSLKVYVNGELIGQDNYKVTLNTETKNDVERVTGFKLELTNMDLVNRKSENTVVRLDYTATMNEDAVVDIPESNDVTFHYGNNPSRGNTPVPTKPADSKIEFTKTWADKTPVDGDKATFELRNAQTGEVVRTVTVSMADGKTNVTVSPGNDSEDGIKFSDNSPTQAVEVTLPTGAKKNATQWNFEFTGLDNDTEYKIVETDTAGTTAEYLNKETGKIEIVDWTEDNPQPKNPTEPKVVRYGKRFVKADEVSGKRLDKAVFVVSDDKGNYLVEKSADKRANDLNEFNAARDAYHKAVKDNESDQNIQTLYTAFEQAGIKMNNHYEWKAFESKEKAAAGGAYKTSPSDTQGKFEIKNLQVGTYYLEEVAAPDGYAVRNNPQEFEVGLNSYTSPETGVTYAGDNSVNDDEGKQALRVDNKQLTIPQTGGIGSLIFYVAGAAIVVAAIVAMKRRNSVEA